MKTCSTCKKGKVDKSFSKDSARPDGLYPVCKSCRHKKRSKYSVYSLHCLGKRPASKPGYVKHNKEDAVFLMELALKILKEERWG
jgi:hypothetical protein